MERQPTRAQINSMVELLQRSGKIEAKILGTILEASANPRVYQKIYIPDNPQKQGRLKRLLSSSAGRNQPPEPTAMRAVYIDRNRITSSFYMLREGMIPQAPQDLRRLLQEYEAKDEDFASGIPDMDKIAELILQQVKDEKLQLLVGFGRAESPDKSQQGFVLMFPHLFSIPKGGKVTLGMFLCRHFLTTTPWPDHYCVPSPVPRLIETHPFK